MEILEEQDLNFCFMFYSLLGRCSPKAIAPLSAFRIEFE